MRNSKAGRRGAEAGLFAYLPPAAGGTSSPRPPTAASCVAPRPTPRPLLRTTTQRSRTVGGCAKRSRAWAVQARSTDRVLHQFETTGGHARTAGG
ncbi:MAG: hypothetical protein LBD24_08225 [Spirochaetaceae bacterium]|nr:hypothetical protein [Spirochaetaceae bacterium]